MNVILNRILILIFAHLIGDYVFQSNFIANFKSKNNFILFVHSGLWTGSICVGLFLIGRYSLWKVAFLLIGHFVIDYWKGHKYLSSYSDLYIDQIIHMIQLGIVYFNF